MSTEVFMVERKEWAGLLGGFPDRTVFHTLPWLDTVAASRGMKVLLAAARRDGECVAVWPVLETWKGPLRILGSPVPGSATTYLGPLFRPGVEHEPVVDEFLRHETFRRYAYFACRVVDRSRPIDLGRWGFDLVRRFPTYWMDVDEGEEALWRRLTSECRGRIRKARKLGIEVRREETSDFLDDFWRMTLETFARSNTRPTHDRTFVRELWDRLHPEGKLLVLSAFHDGRRLATLMLPHDDRTMYYWAGASDQEHRRLPSNNLLHWEAMLEANRLGLAVYDLVSSNGGPGRFKGKFRPRLVEMATYWERSPSRWLGFAKRQYERYRRLRLGIPARSDGVPEDDE